MAYAYLHKTTGEGDVFAADRLEATEVFVCQIDDAADDPITPVEALRPLGKKHDRPRFESLQVQRYVQRRTENPLVWFVEVVYDYPGRPGFAGWLTEMAYGEETKRIVVDLDHTIIGAHKYDPIPEPEPPTAAYFVESPTGRIWLKRADGPLNRKREGLDIFSGASTVVISRTLRHMTAEIMRAVQGYQHTYNDAKFLAWQEGELLFRQGVIREEVGPPDPQTATARSEALVYPVELHFAVKFPSEDEPEGWRSVRKLEYFRDAQGNELVVQEHVPTGGGAFDEIVAWHEYWRYRSSSFADIISVLEGGDVGGTSGGRLGRVKP